MANKLYDENSVKAVADAIRAKNGSTEQYKLADMPQAIENIQTAPEGDWRDYIGTFQINHRAQTSETLNVVLPKYATSLYRSFSAKYGEEGVTYKKLIISKLDEEEFPVTSMSEMFYYNRGTTELFVNFDTSHVVAFNNMCERFAPLHTIHGVLDLSSTTGNLSTAFNCGLLANITFKAGTIRYSISFINSGRLSNDSIQSIIDGLAQVETAQTLTFHANVKAKLTEEQIAVINEKGWTLA